MSATNKSTGESGPEVSNEEFHSAFHLAFEIGVLGPLRKYVESGKPIPDEMVHIQGRPLPQSMSSLVAELLGGSRSEPQPARGRPRRIASKAPLREQAERNATWLVAIKMKNWRNEHRRKRVPGREVDQIIAYATAEAAKEFHIPVNTIKKSNIRALLKSGRFVVPSRLQTRGNDWCNATFV